MIYTIENKMPRDNIPIKNKVQLINTSHDDFHYVLYYLDNNKCKIIIRRLDSDGGWGINLKLKIFSNNKPEKSETFSIGSCDINCKILNLYTQIQIEPIIYNGQYNQLIPKIIFQTTHSKEIENIIHYNSIMTYIELNPEYEYRIFDDEQSRIFIKDNFDTNTLKAYDLLISGAFKADLFRYCYLYINGGCYFDCKSILRKPLREIILSNDDFILCKDIGTGYYNAVMMSIPKNNLVMDLIEVCVDNILNFKTKFNINDINFNNVDNILSLTGPVLVYKILFNKIDSNKVVKLNHLHNNNHYHNYMKWFVEYKGEYIITKQYYNYVSNGIHYSDLWKNKKVLFE